MGGQLEEPSETSQSIKTYFHTLFGYFLSIGMSYREFWDEDVELVNDYVNAENIRQTKLNNQLWLQGMYNRLAIGSCLSKNAKYPNQPIPLSQRDIDKKKHIKVERLKQALKAKAKKKEE